ncbi:MAG TPA: ABC transporter substrate-binding protein [Candidatus Binatia bacterium]|jgi:ABC-type nitrate/sulfonate/bicarbonate transport system substrate-binding protein
MSEPSKEKASAIELLSILAPVLFFLGYVPLAGAQGLKEIRIGSSDVTSTNFSTYYAKDRRFFEKEGLDPKMIIVKTEAILAALSAGELGYTTFSTSAVEATLIGMPFRLIAVANEQPVWGLVVPKSVNQVPELRGKKIGVSSFGGTIYSGAVYVLKHFGVTAKDVTFLAIGNTLTRVAALKKGAIDAAVIAAPGDIVAAKEGFKILLDVGSIYRAPMGGISTTVNRIHDDPAEVRKVVRAVVAASRAIKNPQNKEDVVAYIATLFKLDRAAAEEFYRRLLPSLSTSGVVDKDKIQLVVDSAVERGLTNKPPPDPNRLVDFSFARELGS